MSTTETTSTGGLAAGLTPSHGGSGWPLWRRQIAGIVRLELRKTLRSKRTIPVVLLALAPVVLLTVLRIELIGARDGEALGHVQEVFANIYQGLILVSMVFFGSLLIFMNLFRGEVIDRSLHYYFLAPVRREVLVAGKYVAGLVVGIALFATSTLLSYLIIMTSVHGFDATSAMSLGHLAAYLGTTMLAVVGYGALFLLLGLFFRNPVIPALVLYAWEWANFLLPAFLKRLSVVHYLKSLCPVAVSEGPFALLAEPARPISSIAGLVLFATALLVVAGFTIRRMEVTYADD